MQASELKNIRIDLGFTQKKMAAILFVSLSLYKKMESGERVISSTLQRRLTEYLQKPAETKLEATVDWFKIRFKTLDFRKVIEEVLCLKVKDFFISDKSYYGYSEMITYGSIRVLYQKKAEKIDSGVLIEFTGQGCREMEYVFERQNRTWRDFLQAVFEFSEKNRKESTLEDYLAFPRFDIALDEMYCESGNLDLYDVRDRFYDGHVVVSKFKSFSAVESREKIQGVWKNKGLTLNFGSRQSSIMVRMYQKDYEQAFIKNVSVGYIREVYGLKNRYEIEFHDMKAFDIVSEWYLNELDLAVLGARVMNNYFTVYNRDQTLDERWDNLLGTQSGFRFVARPRRVNFSRTKSWVMKISSAMKLLAVADVVDNTNELADIIAEKDFSEAHLKMAEKYCSDRGFNLEEVLAIVENKKDKFQFKETV